MSSPRTAVGIATAALALGLGACGGGGEGKPLPREQGSDPLALQAAQDGPEESVVTVHWLGRSCSEIEAEPDEGDREIAITLGLPRAAPCSGPRSAQQIGVPLERGIEGRQIVDGRTKEKLALATCQAPGRVPKAIKRSICKVERGARQGR